MKQLIGKKIVGLRINEDQSVLAFYTDQGVIAYETGLLTRPVCGAGQSKKEIHMSEIEKIARAGKLVCVDKGEYSDYDVTGFFVVLRDFNPREELDEYLNANPKQKANYCFKPEGFLAKLLEKGLLLEIEYGTLYLGSGSSTEWFRFTP